MKGGPEGCSKFLLDLRRKVNMAGNESGTRMWGYGCGRPEEAIGEAKGVGQEEKREMRPATRSGRSMCMRRGDGGSRERLFAAATSKANANEPLGDSRRRLCFQHPALPLSPACIYLAAPSSSPGSNCGSTPSFSVRGRPALPRPAPPAKTSGSNRPLIKSCNFKTQQAF